jgi:O-succinylbenzoic acid--CoA ligase
VQPLTLAAAARSHPRRLAWLADGESFTFAQAAGLAGRIAARLAAEGTAPGDRIALVAESSAATLATLFGIVEAGCTLVPLHPRWTHRERSAALSLARPRLTLGADDTRELLDAARRGGRGLSRQPPEGAALAVVFTSGSSGAPKGVALSPRAFAASAASAERVVPHGPRERSLLCMPLAHVGGLSLVTRALAARRAVVVEPRFDAEHFLEAVRTRRVTRASVVPAMLDLLLDADRRGDLARLRLLLLGGAACPAALLEECAARGIRARTSYGMSETCAMITLSPPVVEGGDHTSGRALPGVELEIQDDEGRVLGRGRSGHIAVRGAMRMSGYLDAPPLDPSSWLDTGDLGQLDERGRLTVHGRASDCINTGAEKVAPAEVEAVLEAIPGVRHALVFGVPDPRWGQLVAAAVVLDGRRPADERVLRTAIDASLASFKRPRRLCFVEALPALPSGKVDRAGAAALLGERLRPFPG